MTLFNLAENLIKEAMGYSWQQGREQYHWWDYEELTGGGDESWEHWVMADRSLSDVLRDAANFRSKTFSQLRYTYGLNPTEISKIFKTYIGYHPAYGAYLCSIGPYLGSTFGDAQDKFGYFIIRKRKSSQDEISDAVRKNIENYMSTYDVELTPADLQFVVKGPEGAYDSSRKRQKKVIREVVTSLDPENPEAQDFFNRSPIAGEGSHFGLNAQGLEKVIRGKWGELYEQAVAEKAVEEGITPAEVMQRELRDLDFLNAVYSKLREKYEQAVASGEAAATGMDAPPRFLDLSLPGKSGSIMFRAIPTNTLQSRQLGLRKEILDIMNGGIVDPQAIHQRLNHSPQRKTRPISMEEVEDRVNIIKGLPGYEDANYEQMINDTSEQITSLESKRGFDDLKTAFEMAKLYFTNLPVDPSTKGKLQVKYSPKMVFDPPENFTNVTDEDLSRLREERNLYREREEDQEATEGEIEDQIGETLEPQVTPEIPKQPEPEPEPEEVSTTPEAMEDLFANTITNLMKISAELDEDGADDAAEEIHKVIRKYQKRIR